MKSHVSAAASILLLYPLTGLAQIVIPTGTTRYDADTPGSYILPTTHTRSVTSGNNEVIRIANTGTPGTYSLTIDGSIFQSGTGRGIRTSTANVNFLILINQTGFVRSTTDDAIQGRGGPFHLTNLGTLYSGPNFSLSTPIAVVNTGRGLNLRDAMGGGVIVNGSETNTTALIRADGGDAVRIGSNFTFTNYGIILGNGLVNDSSANNVFGGGSTAETFAVSDGFSFEDQDSSGSGVSNSSLDNYGVISGARHGVEAGSRGTNITVTNRTSGVIIGRNGSGVGFDTLETDPSKIIVHNHGLIRGDYAGVGNVIDRTGLPSPTHDGDGDGIDIDGAATIYNYATGQILSTGAGGFDSNGRANNSEAISIGGGLIVNDGLIRGASRGVLVNNDTVASRSGVAATTIINNLGGTIEGLDGYAIRLENKLGDARDNDTIINHGTIIGRGAIPDPDAIVLRQNGLFDPNSVGTLDGITYTGTGSARFIRGDGSAIQTGQGDDEITNTGIIIGTNGRAINMEGGNDTLHFLGGTINGTINGGTGINTLHLGAGISHDSAVENFQLIHVATGTSTLNGMLSGSTLTKRGAGTLELTNANTYSDLTTIEAGTLLVNNTIGSATGTGPVTVNSGATLAGNGIISGAVTVQNGAILAPGNSPGQLTLLGGLHLVDGSILSFELGTFSDSLVVQGDLSFTGSGAAILNIADAGGLSLSTYTLITFDTLDDFDLSRLVLGSRPAGVEGHFVLGGSSLQFNVTAIPEPSTYVLIALGLAGLCLIRRFPQSKDAGSAIPRS